jgi:Na+-transporting methylmalonyl-CoA/oxaloacetate decarboxylase gamma subunit
MLKTKNSKMGKAIIFLRSKTAGIIGMALMFLILMLLVSAIRKQQEEIFSYKGYIKGQATEIKAWKDEKQRWHTQTEITELRNAQALKLIARYDKDFSDLHKNVSSLKKNLSNLQYASIVGMESHYDNRGVPIKDTLIVLNKDTTKAYVVNIQDSSGWYSITALAIRDQLLNVNINTRDSLTTVLTYKRKWFLGRKRYYQEIVSHNPHSRIVYSKSILLRK